MSYIVGSLFSDWGTDVETQLVILEAMKLEIAVKTPDDAMSKGITTNSDKLVIEKVLVKPGDTVTAGSHLALLRRHRKPSA